MQELAGHTSLAMTQRYIEGDTEAKRKLVALCKPAAMCALCGDVHPRPGTCSTRLTARGKDWGADRLDEQRCPRTRLLRMPLPEA